MARSYAAYVTGSNPGSNTSCFLGVFQTASAGLVRPKIYEFDFGPPGTTPNDYASRIGVGKLGAAPTGGNVSQAGVALDGGDPASLATYYSANTGGGTLASVVFNCGVNMRATFRWVAAPTKEIVGAATQNNGVAMYVMAQSTAYAPEATMYWEE